jgi:hypothetical protein
MRYTEGVRMKIYALKKSKAHATQFNLDEFS